MSNQTPELSSDGRPGVEDPKSQPTRPLLVVPDTNLLTSNHLLQTVDGSALMDLLSRGNGRILLPAVIERELSNVLRRKLATDIKRAAELVWGLQAIIQKDVLRVPDSTELLGCGLIKAQP
jgi:hypothetical protein